MTAALQKLNLTAHVISSVAWLGAVASFLVLGVAGLTSHNAEIVRGAYLAMNLIGQFIIVPLSFAALLSGLIQSLGTHWGLFRHYWVLVKFTLTIGATALLLLHQFTAVARAASQVASVGSGTLPEGSRLGIQLVGDASLAVLVLLATATLSVYKPWGRTRYGWRKQHEMREALERTPRPISPKPHDPDNESGSAGLPLGLKIFIAAIVCVIVVGIVLSHVSGGSHMGHGH